MATLLLENARNMGGACFNYGVFIRTSNNGEKPSMDCGTQVCAVGLAAVSGKFPGLGFEYDASDRAPRVVYRKGRTLIEDPFHAAQEIFEVNYEQARFLFASAPIKSTGAEGEIKLAEIILKFISGVDLTQGEGNIY